MNTYLSFILTYDCNFRCTYCDIDKKQYSMNYDVIEKVITIIKKSTGKFDIKFFWGEPLLEKEKIFSIVEKAWDIWKYTIVTNASLVSDEFMRYCKDKDIKIHFSIDWKEATQKKERISLWWDNFHKIILNNLEKYNHIITVNQVITPLNVRQFSENFIFLYNRGVRSFNLLTAYLRNWTREHLLSLDSELKKILQFLKWKDKVVFALPKEYKPFFFNRWYIVDVWGDIYASDIILFKQFESYKFHFKIGNIFDCKDALPFLNDEKLQFIETLETKIKSEVIGVKKLTSSNYASKILFSYLSKYNTIYNTF